MQFERNTKSKSEGLKAPKSVYEIGAPKHPVHEIKSLVKQHYDIDGLLVPLDGERDQNFLVDAGGARRWVVKVSSDAAGIANADYQAALLSHLEETALHLPLPRNVASKHGENYIAHRFKNGQSGAVRLITYLEGRPFSVQKHRRDAWAGRIGAFQGRLCRALHGFHHVGATAFMPWNSSSKEMFNRETLAYLEMDIGSLVAPHLDRLRSYSLPALQEMRSQVVHNDIHPGNVLMDDRGQISGIIDFGDAIRAPIIQELAVSATSLIEFSPTKHRGLIAELIEGFCSECPLFSDELALLHDAILLRSILSVALGRVKDGCAPPAQRPHPASKASEVGLRAILSLDDNAPWAPRLVCRFANG